MRFGNQKEILWVGVNDRLGFKANVNLFTGKQYKEIAHNLFNSYN
jgi:hypothetical protein